MKLVSRVVAVSMVLTYVAGLVFQLRIQAAAGADADAYEPALGLAFAFVVTVGAFLVVRRPGHPIGWLLAAAGLMVGAFPALETYALYQLTRDGTPDAFSTFAAWVNSWYWMPLLGIVLIFVPLLFPDGRLPSRRWRWIFRFLLASFATMVLLGMFGPTLSGQARSYEPAAAPGEPFLCELSEHTPGQLECHFELTNPVGIAALPALEDDSSVVFLLLSVSVVVGFGTALASIIVRFRRSRGVERQQVKWFLYATGVLPVLIVAEDSVLGDLAFVVAIAAMPTAMAIAILRYRLYDIDRIVSRTVSYALIVAILLGVYAGAVVVLRATLAPLVGDSDIAVAASTLTVAAIFSPLRRRVQRRIDRVFDRRGYDAQQLVGQFAARLRDEIDLGNLQHNLRATVSDAVAPVHVSLWTSDQAKT